jgi:hypothetical protein
MSEGGPGTKAISIDNQAQCYNFAIVSTAFTLYVCQYWPFLPEQFVTTVVTLFKFLIIEATVDNGYETCYGICSGIRVGGQLPVNKTLEDITELCMCTPIALPLCQN